MVVIAIMDTLNCTLVGPSIPSPNMILAAMEKDASLMDGISISAHYYHCNKTWYANVERYIDIQLLLVVDLS